MRNARLVTVFVFVLAASISVVAQQKPQANNSSPGGASVTAKIVPVPNVGEGEMAFCGIVESLSQRDPVIGRGPQIFVTFNDNRRALLTGIPEVTIEKGKMYSFVVKRNANGPGFRELVRTELADVCGYDKKK